MSVKQAKRRRPRAKVQRGVCSGCGCTERRACEMLDGEPCYWVNAERTLCSKCQIAGKGVT